MSRLAHMLWDLGFDISEEEQGEWWDENPDEADSRGSGHRYTTFQIFTEWFHRLLAGAFVGPLVILNWFLVRRDFWNSPRVRGFFLDISTYPMARSHRMANCKIR